MTWETRAAKLRRGAVKLLGASLHTVTCWNLWWSLSSDLRTCLSGWGWEGFTCNKLPLTGLAKSSCSGVLRNNAQNGQMETNHKKLWQRNSHWTTLKERKHPSDKRLLKQVPLVQSGYCQPPSVRNCQSQVTCLHMHANYSASHLQWNRCIIRLVHMDGD